jgi:RNA polymerase sigma-70 factor (ECF subfamily)
VSIAGDNKNTGAADETHCHQLMLAAQSGDQTKYRELLSQVDLIARRHLTQKLHLINDLDDLCQEILLSVHNARHTFDPQKPIHPWLYAIINYRFQDYLRAHYRARRHVTQELTSAEETISPEDPQTTWEYRNLSQKLLSYLLPQQRRIIQMLYMNGHSAEEVSVALNLSVANVRTTAHRATKLIRKKMATHYENH